MDRVRDVCSTALALRRTRDVRVRQPLKQLVVAGAGVERLRPYLDLVLEEVNVKEVVLSEAIESHATFQLQVNARALGPRLGPETKRVIAASKKGEWRSLDDGRAEVAGQILEPGEFQLLLRPAEGVACQALSSNDMIAALDFDLTEALVQEGQARDLVRLVQQARREAGLHVSDRIRLGVTAESGLQRALAAFRDYVAENVLATEIDLEGGLDDAALFIQDTRLGGEPVRITLAKAG